MKYRLQDLIDIQQFQSLQDQLNRIYSFPCAITDEEGNILASTALQDICTKFHRQNKECEKICIESDQFIRTHLAEANPSVDYRCPHGLVDSVTPIIIEGKHLGNYFIGQFFFEKPDVSFFKKQAQRYGLDEQAYIEAVQKVPIWTLDQLNNYQCYIKELIRVITGIALKNLRTIESQRKLLENENEHKAIIQTAMDGFWMVDRQGHLLQVNDAYCRMSGYSESELLNRRIGDLDADENDEKIVAHIQKVVAQGEDRFESTHRHKDGSIFFVEVSAQRRTSHNTEQFVVFLHDITARKRTELEKSKLSTQLQQSQKMESVGRLAGGVAHDFNNMLEVILGHAEFALQKVDPANPIHENLTEILDAARRSADLTRQLLAFARKQTVAPRALDLNETIKNMIKMLDRMIGKQITLSWRPGNNLWTVKMDPSQIDQILANLCVNARDAISDSGRITIETENYTMDDAFCRAHEGFTPGEYVRLVVGDSGCGMDKETISHVFEPFFTTKEVGLGTGLGLATVYGAVKQNNGFIDVQSLVGLGTTISIFLPRCTEKTSELRVQETALAQRGPVTILLVEDEPAVLELVARILRSYGYNVLDASAPEDAIHLAAKYGKDIHLLMTDVIMPEMNGRHLARILLSRYPHIKCLFMSGYTADVIDHDNLLKEGIYFIQKPFLLQDLMNKVTEALEFASTENGGSVLEFPQQSMKPAEIAKTE
jgi:two-component system, cell cycle sensor histidine kinase and response regulator CckA